MKAVKFYLLFMLIMCICSEKAYSKDCVPSVSTDTISNPNETILIQHPTPSKKGMLSYEEGCFEWYTCYNDCNFLDISVITIHYGVMVNLPLIDLNDKVVTDEFILGEDILIRRGYYMEQNQKKYFREDNYFKWRINITYELVSEEHLKDYERMLNNVKIYKTP